MRESIYVNGIHVGPVEMTLEEWEAVHVDYRSEDFDGRRWVLMNLTDLGSCLIPVVIVD